MDAPRTHIFVPCAVTIARAKRAAMCDQDGDRDTVFGAVRPGSSAGVDAHAVFTS